MIERWVCPLPPKPCVCGHAFDDHKPAVMSVPLRGQGFYPAKTTIPGNTATLSSSRATYERVECHCGCCEWLPGL